jgi:WD40 repeat protein
MIGHTKSVRSLKWSPSGDQLASCSNDGSIRLWTLQQGHPLESMTGHTDYSLFVYSPRGDVVVSAGDDTTVRLLDVTSGQCHVVIKDSQHAILDMDWKETVDGGYLVCWL